MIGTRSKLVLAALALVLAGIGLALLRTTPQSVRIALPINQWVDEPQRVWPASQGWPGAEFLPIIWKLDAEGPVKLVSAYGMSGTGTLELLLDGKADLAIAAAPPVVTAIGKGAPLQILALTVRASNQVRLLTNNNSAADWLTLPIALRTGTVMESALLGQLRKMGRLDLYRDRKLHIVNIDNPKNVVNALLDGTVQTSATLKPFADFVLYQQSMGVDTRFRDITLPDIYSFASFVVTTEERWREKRPEILKALEIIQRSRLKARAEPAATLELGRHFEAANTPFDAAAPHAWSIDDFTFVTSRTEVVLALENEARLRVAAGLLPSVPEFEKNFRLLDDVEKGVPRR